MPNKKQIAIVNYGLGNLHSVLRIFEYCAAKQFSVILCDNAQAIENADAVVFPGQGAASVCMKAINEFKGLKSTLFKSINNKPFLGICMGMEMLFEYSEENNGVECLSIIPGKVRQFSQNNALKVPHMGWNTISQKKGQDHSLWYKIPDKSYFYFVHSYYCICSDKNQISGTTHYGDTFTSAIMYATNPNFFAIQAHPEKSGDMGLQLIQNFLNTIQ